MSACTVLLLVLGEPDVLNKGGENLTPDNPSHLLDQQLKTLPHLLDQSHLH